MARSTASIAAARSARSASRRKCAGGDQAGVGCDAGGRLERGRGGWERDCRDTAADPRALDQLKIVETIKEGETIYQASAHEPRTASAARPGSQDRPVLANLFGHAHDDCPGDFLADLAAVMSGDGQVATDSHAAR
jgi:hypothetical protein